MLTEELIRKYCANDSNWKSIHRVLGDLYVDNNMSKKEFWHYTSSKGVLGIFKKYADNCFASERVTECSVYASNIRFMNDAKEYREGVKTYKKISGKKLNSEINDNIYLISFCGEGDLLSQWKWYGKNSGIAICFNLDQLKYKTLQYVDKDGKERKDLIRYDQYTKPVNVRYTYKEKKALYNSLVSNNTILK